MGKKDQLNKIFNNSILRPFLPIANKILTKQFINTIFSYLITNFQVDFFN
jgi:hypothetical protein